MSEAMKRGDDNKLPTEPMLLKEYQVKALKPKSKRYDRLVGRGLTLRVNTSGTVAFRYAYRFNGRKCALTLGSFPSVPLAKLLSRYQRANADKIDGIDPADDVKEARQLLLADKHAVADEQGYLEINPASGIKRKGLEESKTRALDYTEETDMVTDSGEIRYFWQVTKTLNPLYRYTFQMMLLTAQRPNEVCGARWEHIYWDEGIWALPNTKNSRIHKIPLVPHLRAHLKTLKAISGHTPFLFPQSREEDGLHLITNKDKPLSAATLNFDTRNRFPDVRAFTSHDLRRTASTHLKTTGSNIYEIGLLLNNGGFSVTDIYARGSDTDTIKKALNKWHRRLDGILDAEQVGNVVNLR